MKTHTLASSVAISESIQSYGSFPQNSGHSIIWNVLLKFRLIQITTHMLHARPISGYHIRIVVTRLHALWIYRLQVNC